MGGPNSWPTIRVDSAAMTIVHVTLKEAARSNAKLKQRLQELVAKLGMRDINQKRFDRYGVLTGEIDEAALPQIEQIEEVAAVERDAARHSQ
jgi:hypothetical protein